MARTRPRRCASCSTLGVPYTDAEIEGAEAAVAGKTEADALIAYLQNLGLDMRNYGEGP